ncbi:EPB1B protein, partial [Atlantisia rogersi]|nr:EPB1B protein [Atlantisia rogersi]
GAGVCTPCPSNSRSTAEASPVCTCRNGYYRADFDPPAAACTSEYQCRGWGWGRLQVLPTDHEPAVCLGWSGKPTA